MTNTVTFATKISREVANLQLICTFALLKQEVLVVAALLLLLLIKVNK